MAKCSFQHKYYYERLLCATTIKETTKLPSPLFNIRSAKLLSEISVV